jgi:hypothetical protein
MISPRGPYFLLAPLFVPLSLPFKLALHLGAGAETFTIRQQKRLAGLSQTLMDLYGSFVTAYLWLRK